MQRKIHPIEFDSGALGLSNHKMLTGANHMLVSTLIVPTRAINYFRNEAKRESFINFKWIIQIIVSGSFQCIGYPHLLKSSDAMSLHT